MTSLIQRFSSSKSKEIGPTPLDKLLIRGAKRGLSLTIGMKEISRALMAQELSALLIMQSNASFDLFVDEGFQPTDESDIRGHYSVVVMSLQDYAIEDVVEFLGVDFAE